MTKNSIIGAEETTIRPLRSLTPLGQDMGHTTEANQAEEVGQGLAQVSRGDLDPAEVQAVGEPTVNLIGTMTSNRTLRMDTIRTGVVSQTTIGKGNDFLKHQKNPIQNQEGNLHLRTR